MTAVWQLGHKNAEVLRKQSPGQIKVHGTSITATCHQAPPISPFDGMCKRIRAILICSENVHLVGLKSVKSLVFYICKMTLLFEKYRELNYKIIVIMFRK